MSLTGFDNYSSVRSSLKLLISTPCKHCRKMLKGHNRVLHLVPSHLGKLKIRINVPSLSWCVSTFNGDGEKNLNVAILLDFSAVEPVAVLINPAVMYYLCESPRDCSCRCRYHCSCRFRHVEAQRRPRRLPVTN